MSNDDEGTYLETNTRIKVTVCLSDDREVEAEFRNPDDSKLRTLIIGSDVDMTIRIKAPTPEQRHILGELYF